MKILLIHNYYQQWGGEDTYYNSLSSLLTRKGHNVFTYSKKSDDIKSAFSKIRIGFGMFWNFEVEKELTKVIKKFNPDLVHFINIFPAIGFTAYYVCAKFNIPIIQNIQTYRLICPKGTLYRDGKICEICIHKRFFYPSILFGCYHKSKMASLLLSLSFSYFGITEQIRLINKLHFPSHFIKNYYIKHFSISTKQTIVLPNFIDTKQKIQKNISNEFNNYFLFVGRLSEEKGVIGLVKAFSMFKNHNLIVIGDGPLKNFITRIVNNSNNIVFKGFLKRDEILPYMKKALCTIIPSPWYEVCPTVLIESFYCGTPVIVPEFGVFKELVENGKTGFFYINNDFQNLQKILFNIQHHPEILASMKIHIRKEFKKKYSDSIHYKSLIKVYKSLVRN